MCLSHLEPCLVLRECARDAKVRLYQASTKFGYSIVREKFLCHLRWARKNNNNNKKAHSEHVTRRCKEKGRATRGTQETLNGAELDEEL